MSKASRGEVDSLQFVSFLCPAGALSGSRVQSLYLFQRENFVINYKLRRAVEEDNDDLVPLVDAHDPRFKKMYGEFYISELLTKHADQGRHLIVAEHGSELIETAPEGRGKYNFHQDHFRLNAGVAVGMLCLNEYVNYDSLREEFELSPYNGLKKLNIYDEYSMMSMGGGGTESSGLATWDGKEEVRL